MKQKQTIFGVLLAVMMTVGWGGTVLAAEADQKPKGMDETIEPGKVPVPQGAEKFQSERVPLAGMPGRDFTLVSAVVGEGTNIWLPSTLIVRGGRVGPADVAQRLQDRARTGDR